MILRPSKGLFHNRTSFSRLRVRLTRYTMKRSRDNDESAASINMADRQVTPATTDIRFTAPSAALTIDKATYASQLDAKLSKLKTLFSDLAMPEVEVRTSEPEHYRMRAEFNVWGSREGERLHYIMYSTDNAAQKEGDSALQPGNDADEHQQPSNRGDDGGDGEGPEEAAAPEPTADADSTAVASDLNAGESNPPIAKTDPPATVTTSAKGGGGGKRGRRQKSRKPRAPRVEISSFPVGSRLINEMMPVVLQACNSDPVLKLGLFQVNFHTTLNGEATVSMLYHKALDERWQAAARALRPVLAAASPSAAGHVPHIIGRSRKQKINLDQDYVLEKLMVHSQQYLYRQYEGSFSQPNAGVCEKMLEWAVDVTKGSSDHDLLELYCGNGNFTIPLSQNFRRVVATEMSKPGVEAAKWNIKENGVSDKVFAGRLSSEEFVETWKAQGTRRRLEGLWDWKDLSLKTLFVDPPRSGLDPESVKLMATFDRIVYISCNPETLHANLKGVAGVTHDVVRFAAFDQFPFTHHLEAGVYLVRKNPSVTL